MLSTQPHRKGSGLTRPGAGDDVVGCDAAAQQVLDDQPAEVAGGRGGDDGHDEGLPEAATLGEGVGQAVTRRSTSTAIASTSGGSGMTRFLVSRTRR